MLSSIAAIMIPLALIFFYSNDILDFESKCGVFLTLKVNVEEMRRKFISENDNYLLS